MWEFKRLVDLSPVWIHSRVSALALGICDCHSGALRQASSLNWTLWGFITARASSDRLYSVHENAPFSVWWHPLRRAVSLSPMWRLLFWWLLEQCMVVLQIMWALDFKVSEKGKTKQFHSSFSICAAEVSTKQAASKLLLHSLNYPWFCVNSPLPLYVYLHTVCVCIKLRVTHNMHAGALGDTDISFSFQISELAEK